MSNNDSVILKKEVTDLVGICDKYLLSLNPCQRLEGRHIGLRVECDSFVLDGWSRKIQENREVDYQGLLGFMNSLKSKYDSCTGGGV